MRKCVAIHCSAHAVADHVGAIVAIDVIRATTTAVTAASRGRQCFLVPSLAAAATLSARVKNALLVGELDGLMPAGFHLNNSPAALAERSDVNRPMILLSSSGTRLVCDCGTSQPVFVACLRNHSAQAAYLAAHHPSVALIGAATRGDFREEDQLCCALIARDLRRAGYEPASPETAALIERWSSASVTSICESASASYLRRSGQEKDLEFILSHVDDVHDVYRFERDQLVRYHPSDPGRTLQESSVGRNCSRRRAVERLHRA